MTHEHHTTSSIKDSVLACVTFLVAVALTRLEAVRLISSHVLGGDRGDGGLYVWLIQTAWPSLSRLPWFNSLAFYPYGYTLAWSDNYLLPSLVYSLLLPLIQDQTVTYNAILLLAQFLNGMSVYALSRQCGATYLPALFAGLAVCCSSALSFHLGHPQLQFLFWAPLALTILLRFVQFPTVLRAASLGACISLAFLTSAYHAIFAALVCTIASATFLAAGWSTRSFAKLCASAFVGILPLALFVPPYLEVRETFGARGLYEPYYFAATGLSFISSSPHSLVYGGTSSWSHAEAYLFPGLAVLLCGIGGVLSVTQSIQHKRAVRILLLACAVPTVLSCFVLTTPHIRPPAMISTCIVLVAAWFAARTAAARSTFTLSPALCATTCGIISALTAILALGPLGNPEKGDTITGVFHVFYTLFPGFDSLRAISRIGLISTTMLAVASSLLLTKMGSRGLTILLTLIVIVENLPREYPLTPQTAALAVFSSPHLRDLREPVIVLPITEATTEDGSVKSWGDFAIKNTAVMNELVTAGVPIVNGYSGQRSKLMLELPRALRNFPDQRSIHALRHIGGLSTVIVIGDWIPSFNREVFLTQLKKLNLTVVSENDTNQFIIEIKTPLVVDKSFSVFCPSLPGMRLRIEAQGSSQDKPTPFEISIKQSQREVSKVALEAQAAIWREFTTPPVSIRREARPIEFVLTPAHGTELALGRTHCIDK